MTYHKDSIYDLLAERQSKYVLFPWSTQNTAHPMHIVSASGCELELFNGHKLLDMNSLVFNANIGHGHPKIKEALRNAAEQACVTHPQMVHEEKARLGENLARISPSAPYKGLVKSFLCLSGAEANENAVKMARLVTGRHKVVTRYRSYHGATLSTIGMSGDYRRIPFDLTGAPGVIRLPDPYPRGSGQRIDTCRLLEEILEVEGPETVACVLLEGITGANGVIIPEADYWPRMRDICSRHGILLIADEVLSGFGRTGKWFGVDHFGVTPDMMTLAKGITGGYAPLGAVMINETIAKHFENNMLWCGLTNYGHPLPCAVANAAIEVYENEKLVENAATRGEELHECLGDLKRSNPLVAEIRSIGLLAAIDLRKSADDERPFVPYRAKGEDAKRAAELQEAFTAAGVLVAVRFGSVLIAPPLSIGKEQLAKGMEMVASVLGDLHRSSK